MHAFTFRLERPDDDRIVRRRTFDQDAAVLAFARKLLGDRPESGQVEIVQNGTLWQRVGLHERNGVLDILGSLPETTFVKLKVQFALRRNTERRENPGV